MNGQSHVQEDPSSEGGFYKGIRKRSEGCGLPHGVARVAVLWGRNVALGSQVLPYLREAGNLEFYVKFPAF